MKEVQANLLPWQLIPCLLHPWSQQVVQAEDSAGSHTCPPGLDLLQCSLDGLALQLL